jgi:predicted HTH domain antitoxin
MKIDKKIIDLIIKNISGLEVLILALLNAKNREPIKSDLFFQKEIFLVLNYIKEMLPNADFISHTLGPYSEVAEKSMNNLNSYNLVKRIEQGYKITDLGMEILKEFKGKLSKNKLEAIEDFKDFLNDLTRDELLVFTYISFPEFTTESGIKDEIYSKRKPVAVSLYKKGKISLEKAAFLSGLSLEEFTKYLSSGT